MRYDLTRCDNLNYKNGPEGAGYVKVVDDNAYFYTNEYWDRERLTFAVNCPDSVCTYDDAAVESIFDTYPNFAIVPRDPETYQEWKAGDILVEKDCPTGDRYHRILEVHNGYIVYDNIGYTGITLATTQDVWNQKKLRLELTPYEKEILHPHKLDFEIGQKLLVRQRKDYQWVMRAFREEDEAGNAVCFDGMHYKLAIPYNEKTWMLLGTTDDYTEEMQVSK
jgi:hypothetical protein